MHLLNTIGDQFLKLGNNNWSNRLDELLHFVETLLLVVHVLLLQLSYQITQNVVFFVLEAANHCLLINDIPKHLFGLGWRQFLKVLGTLLLIVKETDKVVLFAEVQWIDCLLEILFNFLIQWLHMIQCTLFLQLFV